MAEAGARFRLHLSVVVLHETDEQHWWCQHERSGIFKEWELIIDCIRSYSRTSPASLTRSLQAMSMSRRTADGIELSLTISGLIMSVTTPVAQQQLLRTNKHDVAPPLLCA